MRFVDRLAAPLLLVIVVLPAAAASDRAPTEAASPQEVDVVAVVADPQTGLPLVMLQGRRDGRSLVMAIGPAEATGIAVPLQGLTPPRPLTHDLFLTLFTRLNVTVTRVVIHDFRDNTFFATLYLSAAGAEHVLDSRPSDAIALAVRAKAPVFVEDRVFDKGRVTPPRRQQI